MIGVGQHIRLQMWGPNGEVVQDGILPPSSDTSLTFSEGPELVARIAITRFTREQADRMEAWYEENGNAVMYDASLEVPS